MGWPAGSSPVHRQNRGRFVSACAVLHASHLHPQLTYVLFVPLQRRVDLGPAGGPRRLRNVRSRVMLDAYSAVRTMPPGPALLGGVLPAMPGPEVTMSFAVTPLKILADVTSTRTTIHVRGEIDLATAPQFRRELEHWLSHGPSEVWVDLSGVSFMDSAGVHALLIALRTAHLIGSRIALTNTSPQVDRLLAVTGVVLLAARPLTSVRAAVS